MDQIVNLIDGKLVPPLSGEFLDNMNPATGLVYSRVAASKSEDVQKAVESAQAAAPGWAAKPVRERADLLLKLATLIEMNLEKLAVAESIDSGKPLQLARNLEIPRSASNFRFFAEAIGQFHGATYPMSSQIFNYTEHSPLGVVGCISPWNLPLYLFSWKIAPALAAGNTVVAKPSEITPMTAFLLSQLTIEAGWPPGVLNIVHGTGLDVGEALVRHPQVKAISFTGSTGVGQRIAEICGLQLKKVSLELGGKNANIIFNDAPVDKAVDYSIRSSFQNQGQICLCGSRILVQQEIYNEFTQKLLSRVQKLKIGNPLDLETQQGAIVSQAQFQKVLSYIERAKQEGGRLLCGGGAAPGLEGGYYISPTLIENLPPSSALNQEEIFGPVATLIPFKNREEAIAIANGTPYGLACSLWTKDLNQAHQTAQKIQSGLVWVNTWMTRDLRTPFGGVKQSGVGREGGFEALRFFTETKNICIDTDYGEMP